MRKLSITIEGISCEHCVKRIKEALLQNKNIKSVKIKDLKEAHIKCDNVSDEEIINTINDLGYVTKKEYIKAD